MGTGGFSKWEIEVPHLVLVHVQPHVLCRPPESLLEPLVSRRLELHPGEDVPDEGVEPDGVTERELGEGVQAEGGDGDLGLALGRGAGLRKIIPICLKFLLDRIVKKTHLFGRF